MVRFGGRPSCPVACWGGAPASRGGMAPINARRLARLALLILLVAALPFGASARATIRNSLLLLIDTSGSMGSEIGTGNPEIKIDAAKDAAIAAVDRALASGATEVAVLGFSGDCSNPISERLDFTTDGNQLTRFIRGLQASGGTPMADALVVANRFMQSSGTPGTHSQMIVLLADGDNDCGDVAQAMDQLRAAGIVFRHETVGFGIEPTSDAARDLRHVANASGGEYHHAASATQLADVFMEFVDTFTVIDMLGMFGGTATANTPGAQTGLPDSSAGAAPGAQAGASADADKGGFTSMIGAFQAADAGDDRIFGALAIDADQGTAWAWAAGRADEAEAKRAALDECGQGCRIVGTVQDGCAAYAADQARGSSVWAWASAYDRETDATGAALDECARRGGTDCIVRVWACADGPGGGASGRGQDAPASDDTDGTGGADIPFGAFATHPDQVTVWGLAAEYDTRAEAERVALEECGDGCEILFTFEDGCLAYATDGAAGSMIIGWSSGYDTRADAEKVALDECAEGGGTKCAVRVRDCSGG